MNQPQARLKLRQIIKILANLIWNDSSYLFSWVLGKHSSKHVQTSLIKYKIIRLVWKLYCKYYSHGIVVFLLYKYNSFYQLARLCVPQIILRRLLTHLICLKCFMTCSVPYTCHWIPIGKFSSLKFVYCFNCFTFTLLTF